MDFFTKVALSESHNAQRRQHVIAGKICLGSTVQKNQNRQNAIFVLNITEKLH
jgi:hypothetical protein